MGSRVSSRPEVKV